MDGIKVGDVESLKKLYVNFQPPLTSLKDDNCQEVTLGHIDVAYGLIIIIT